MNVRTFACVFVAFLVAMFAFDAIKSTQVTMATVVIQNGEGLNGPEIQVYIPRLAFFNGGRENQVFLFEDMTDEGNHYQVTVLSPGNGIGMVRDLDDTSEYLVVCAPRGLSGEEVLRYSWDRYHPRFQNESWTGHDVPGKIRIYCN